MKATEQGTKSYQLFEGREKQTLLDKYINGWSDRDLALERSTNLIEDINITSSKKITPSVSEEYKKFLLDFKTEESPTTTNEAEDSISALSNLIQSRKTSKIIF